MVLVVHELSGIVLWSDVVTLPRSATSECWNGSRLSKPFEWSLAVDSQCLWFVSDIPAAPSERQLHRSNEFVEGLWEADVAELFVLTSNGTYQEFNVSVDGAWWAMPFSSYRVRASEAAVPHNVAVTIQRSSQSWTAIMAIPLVSLAVEWNRSVAFHICGIVYRHGVPTYLTSKVNGGFPPDFHDSRCFQQAEWTALQTGRRL